ncbi:Rv3654c family TadE-like protein [Geodermatophilus sp. SYSU D01105]
MTTRRRPAGDRGSATVWVVALSGVLAAIGVAVVLVGAAVVGRHRATGAADLAALAGAESAVRSRPDACAAAEGVARANGARLTACSVDPGAIVDVAVEVRVRLGPLGTGSATARARAGPVLPEPAVPP